MSVRMAPAEGLERGWDPPGDLNVRCFLQWGGLGRGVRRRGARSFSPHSGHWAPFPAECLRGQLMPDRE